MGNLGGKNIILRPALTLFLELYMSWLENLSEKLLQAVHVLVREPIDVSTMLCSKCILVQTQSSQSLNVWKPHRCHHYLPYAPNGTSKPSLHPHWNLSHYFSRQRHLYLLHPRATLSRLHHRCSPILIVVMTSGTRPRLVGVVVGCRSRYGDRESHTALREASQM